MKKILLLLLMTFVACGGGSDDGGNEGNSCGVLNLKSVTTKVYNGESCSSAGPVMKLLITSRNLITGEVSTSNCSGVAVSLTTILTAAHCVEPFFNDTTQPLELTVESDAALYSISGGGISDIAAVPEYFRTRRAYDFGFIRLSTPLRGVAPVPILVSVPLQVGDIVTQFGYGADEYGFFGNLKAGESTITAISNELIETTINSSNQVICGGDSGGPIIKVFNGVSYLVGITSFGGNDLSQYCGSINYFGNMQNPIAVQILRGYAPDASFR